MIQFTTPECQYLLGLIREKEGFGYSDKQLPGSEAKPTTIAALQGKLSILLELAGRMGR